MIFCCLWASWRCPWISFSSVFLSCSRSFRRFCCFSVDWVDLTRFYAQQLSINISSLSAEWFLYHTYIQIKLYVKIYYGRKCRKQNFCCWFVDGVLYFFNIYNLANASLLHVPYLSCLSLGSAHLRPFCPSQLVCDRIQDLQSKNGCCMLPCPLEGIRDKDEVQIVWNYSGPYWLYPPPKKKKIRQINCSALR